MHPARNLSPKPPVCSTTRSEEPPAGLSLQHDGLASGTPMSPESAAGQPPRRSSEDHTRRRRTIDWPSRGSQVTRMRLRPQGPPKPVAFLVAKPWPRVAARRLREPCEFQSPAYVASP